MLKFLNPSRNRYAGLIFVICVLCGPIGAGIGIWAAWSAHTKQPMPLEDYIALGALQEKVKLRADQFLRLALTGKGEQDRRTLAAMVVDPRAVSLPPVPWNVTSTRITDVDRIAVEPDSAEWKVVFEVGFTAPGTGTIIFTNMKVVMLSSGGSFKAAALPKLDQESVPAMQVGPGYTVQVDLGSALGTTVSGFVSAFYVPGTDSTSLGRYVIGDFWKTNEGKPVKASPFTSATVETILSKSALPSRPKAGDAVDVLVTIRGGATETTWFTMQTPLHVVFTEQDQWAVENIPETVEVGKIMHR